MLEKLNDLNKDSFIPIRNQLADIIISFIQENGLNPGDPLPSESDLIKRFEVSRITVRNAMLRLRLEGYVQTVQGKGTFVAKPTFRQDLSSLESIEAYLDKKNMMVENIITHVGEIRPLKMWLKNLNLPDDATVFKVERIKKIKERIFALENNLIPNEIANRFSVQELKEKSYIDLFNRFDDTIVHKIVHFTKADLAWEDKASKLEIPSGSPVLLRRYIYFNHNDKPVLTGIIRYISENVELEVTLYEKSGNNEVIPMHRM